MPGARASEHIDGRGAERVQIVGCAIWEPLNLYCFTPEPVLLHAGSGTGRSRPFIGVLQGRQPTNTRPMLRMPEAPRFLEDRHLLIPVQL